MIDLQTQTKPKEKGNNYSYSGSLFKQEPLTLVDNRKNKKEDRYIPEKFEIPTDPSETMDEKEVAKLFKVSTKTIRVWRYEGKLKHFFLLGRSNILYTKHGIREFLATCYKEEHETT